MILRTKDASNPFREETLLKMQISKRTVTKERLQEKRKNEKISLEKKKKNAKMQETTRGQRNATLLLH